MIPPRLHPLHATPMPQVRVATAVTRVVPWGFAELFVISQTALPALLYLPGTQAIRLPIRISAYVISLAALGWWLTNARLHRPLHRAGLWLAGAAAVLVAMLFHPTTALAKLGLQNRVHAALYGLRSGLVSISETTEVYDARWR